MTKEEILNLNISRKSDLLVAEKVLHEDEFLSIAILYKAKMELMSLFAQILPQTLRMLG